ncbi:MAG TPA: methyltransferase [Thermomicrobiales bacterium]|nr:methyltransferase [Thermomicrobiales bacterium]
MAHMAQPTRIQNLQQAGQELSALLAGMELDLFTSLDAGPLRADELAAALRVAPKKLSPLLYGLVVAGLLSVEDGRFANTDESAQFLVRGKPTYLGDARGFWSELVAAGLTVAESVRTGIPQARHNYGAMSAGELAVTLGGLHPAALGVGKELAARYDFSAYRHILDVAGGTGGASIALIRAYPGLRATIADLPGVLPLARRYAAEAGLSDRITTVAADLRCDAVPGRFDAAVVCKLVQVLAADDARAALAHVGRSLGPGGVVYVIGIVLDDSRLTPAPAARINVLCLSFYDGGQAYTEGEYRAWLAEADFVDIARDEPIGGSGILRARKAG